MPVYTLCSCSLSDLTFQANVFFARVKNSAVYVTVLEMRLNIIYAWSILNRNFLKCNVWKYVRIFHTCNKYSYMYLNIRLSCLCSVVDFCIFLFQFFSAIMAGLPCFSPRSNLLIGSSRRNWDQDAFWFNFYLFERVSGRRPFDDWNEKRLKW